MSLRFAPGRRFENPLGLRRLLAAAVLAATASAAWAAIPSDALRQSLRPAGNVNDFAGVLSRSERAALEDRTVELRHKTGAQFAVVILKSLEGGQIDDFTNKLFAQWGVGEKGKNNGVMLLVALKDRKARIEVGYGLEPVLPDALAGRVLDEMLFPAFKRQQYAQGLTLAVARVAQIIERGEPASAKDKEKSAGPVPSLVAMTLFLALFVAIGSATLGGAVAGHKGGLTLWASFFTGIPMWIAWLATGVGFGFLTALAASCFACGWFFQRSDDIRQIRHKLTKSNWASGWTWGGSGWGGGGGGFGGGGFGGGGGGFGGGCSGGGGASGGW